jgi:hypothetical protein
MKTNLDKVNDVTYKNAKFNTKSFILWTTKKKTNSDKIWRFENIHAISSSTRLSFLCIQNTKYLNINFCKFVG